MTKIPASMVKRMLFVKSAATMAAMPANNRTFPKETKNFSDCIKSSGNIKAVITAGGTYRKHLCIHEGISQIPKRKIKDNLVKYVKIPPKSKTNHTFMAIFSSNVQKQIPSLCQPRKLQLNLIYREVYKKSKMKPPQQQQRQRWDNPLKKGLRWL